MAVALVSTGVQFPDSTIQTTAATAGASIKSTQRGAITIVSGNYTATATISSVNTGKTELRYLGNAAINTSNISETLARIDLTNSTTITATRYQYGASNNTVVSWELTEWN